MALDVSCVQEARVCERCSSSFRKYGARLAAVFALVLVESFPLASVGVGHALAETSIVDSLASYQVCKFSDKGNKATTTLSCPVSIDANGNNLGPLTWYHSRNGGPLVHISNSTHIYVLGKSKENVFITGSTPADSGYYVALLIQPNIPTVAICNISLRVVSKASQCTTALHQEFNPIHLMAEDPVVLNITDGENLYLDTSESEDYSFSTPKFFFVNSSRLLMKNTSRVSGVGTSRLHLAAALSDNDSNFVAVRYGVKTALPMELWVVVREFTLNVKERTRITCSPANMSVISGQAITVHCSATGPSPSISLHHNTKVLAHFTSSDARVQSGGVDMRFSKMNSTYLGLDITFSNVQTKHAGSYRCQAKSISSKQAEDNTTFYLAVQEKPSVVLRRDNCAGSSLICTATGTPLPNIWWKKDGKTLTTGLTSQTSSGNKVTSTIQHGDITGRYVCIAGNSVGSMSAVLDYDGSTCVSEGRSSQAFVWVAPAVLGPVIFLLLLLLLLRWRRRRRKQCNCTAEKKCKECMTKGIGAAVGSPQRLVEGSSVQYCTTESTLQYTHSHCSALDMASSRDSPASISSTTRIISVTKNPDRDLGTPQLYDNTNPNQQV